VAEGQHFFTRTLNESIRKSNCNSIPGDTPRDLRDLIGQRGGEAEGQLMERGYKLSNSLESGDAVYSNWRNSHSGQCVTLRSVDGWYESIVYANDYDCDQ